MPERLLQLDDLRTLESPEGIAALFRKLGYNAQTESVDVSDLELSARSTEAIYDAHLIASQGYSDLQVLLFKGGVEAVFEGKGCEAVVCSFCRAVPNQN